MDAVFDLMDHRNRFRRQRRFVHDTVTAFGINMVRLAPVLWEDMMDVNALIEVHLDIDRFPGPKIVSSIPQQESIQSLVRGTIACA